MDNNEALNLIKSGNAHIWNDYRDKNPLWRPDLSGKKIITSSLKEFNLSECNLSNSCLTPVASGPPLVDLFGTNFSGANLCGSNLLNTANYLNGTKFDEATYDLLTKFPTGLDPIEVGALYATRAHLEKVSGNRNLCFISYAWANDDVVLAIDAWLRRKRIITKLDKRDFFAGSSIRDEIIRVMKECDTVLIFHSKDSVDKPWPGFERELAADLQIQAKRKKKKPLRIIYVVIDDIGLPTASEENKIAVMAKGKQFELVCEEIYHGILQIPKEPRDDIDLDKWTDYVF